MGRQKRSIFHGNILLYNNTNIYRSVVMKLKSIAVQNDSTTQFLTSSMLLPYVIFAEKYYYFWFKLQII